MTCPSTKLNRKVREETYPSVLNLVARVPLLWAMLEFKVTLHKGAFNCRKPPCTRCRALQNHPRAHLHRATTKHNVASGGSNTGE